MKIRGQINIMGIKEIVFRVKDGKRKKESFDCSKYMFDPNCFTWCRIIVPHSLKVKRNGFNRTHEQMSRTIKALALNPNAELSFNDGLLIIDLLR